jgi:Flp pilus assembly protein TadD
MLLQHDFTKAEDHLTNAIKLNGKNPATAINLAITKVQLGKYTHAVRLLQHAIALKPNDQTIREMLANLQATLNQ